MDTKRLLELAIDAGIDPKHDDVAHDCIEPWTKYLINSPEEMADVWIDFLAEMDIEGDSFKAIITHLGRAQSDFDAISKKSSHIPANIDSTVIWGHSLQQNMVYIGLPIQKALAEGAQKYVEKNVDEWWDDCMNFAGDMEADAADAHGDYLYDQRKDEGL